MAAPLGNQNARKAKVWEGALRAALAQYENAEAGIKPGEALRKIAEVVVGKALVGDKDAVREIGDRLDGKPAQAITGADGGPVQLEKIERTIVDPKS
jgi:hypothetical protein